MKARVRPSASCTRRRIISRESSELASSSPLSLRITEAGWPFGTSNTAVTCPCSTPLRTRPASPRPPSASANASRRIDLPAPVSPVKTANPRETSISSRSIRTMSRIDRRASMRDQSWWSWFVANPSFAQTGAFQGLANFGFGTLAETQLLEGLGDVGTRILARLDATGFYKIIGVLIPLAVGKIVPEHGSGGLSLADDADRHIGLGEPGQRFLDMPRGLVAGDHGLEAVDGGGVVALFHVIAADVHFLAGELVARAFQLGLGGGGIFRGRIFADHLFQRRDRLLGAALVAGNIRNLVVMRCRNQVLRVSRIGAAGMQRDVTGRRTDAVVVVA